MLIKSQHTLQPAEQKAHSVVVYDDHNNPLFAAMHMADGIVYASLGENDFATVLKLVGIESPPKIVEIPPAPK
jgi:hypothetical protein